VFGVLGEFTSCWTITSPYEDEEPSPERVACIYDPQWQAFDSEHYCARWRLDSARIRRAAHEQYSYGYEPSEATIEFTGGGIVFVEAERLENLN